MRPIFLVVAGLLVAASCQASPADCVEKGNIAACTSLCDTGKEEFLPLCYEERARKVQACAEKDTECAAACELWAGSESNEVARNTYRAKLGSDEKVAALQAKCDAAK